MFDIILNKIKDNNRLLITNSFVACLCLIILVVFSTLYNDTSLVLTHSLLALTVILLGFIAYLFTLHNKQQQNELQKLSNTDKITGLNNQNRLYETLTETVEKHLRVKQKSSLLIIELDPSHKISEHYSYIEANQTLANIAKRLKDNLRITDQLYRLEGNKFGIVAFNTTLKGAGHLAEILRDHIQQSKNIHNEKITISIGVAQISILDDADNWLKRAEVSLFGAKSTAGGNTTFLAIPEDRGANYAIEPFVSNITQTDNKKTDNNIISLKTFRHKKLIDSESSL